jgi:hypothetical protein
VVAHDTGTIERFEWCDHFAGLRGQGLYTTDFPSNMGRITGLVVDKMVTAFRRGWKSVMEWRKLCRSQDSVMFQ